MKIPNFDDVDLGIVAIATIVILIGVVLSWTGKLEVGLGVVGSGITAISTLAGRKPVPKEKE